MSKTLRTRAGAAVSAAGMSLGMTFGNLQTALQAAIVAHPLVDDDDWPYVVDIDADSMTFIWANAGAYYEQDFSIDGDAVSLNGAAREVQSVTSWKPVPIGNMAARFDSAGDLIYEGEIFRAGNYPDKGTNATPADLINLCRTLASRVVPLWDQHNDRSPFYKSLHEKDAQGNYRYGLVGVAAKEGGNQLWGRLRFPKWMKDALGDETPVSVGITLLDGHPVDIRELSLVDEGRVPTAIVARKFEAAYAAFAGSRHSKADMDKIQAVHDAATDLGATCEGEEPGDGAAMAGSRHSKADMADIQDMHDLAVKQGATCAAADGSQMGAPRQHDTAKAPHAPAKEKRMSLLKKAKAFFASNAEARQAAAITDADLQEEEGAAGAPGVPANVDPTVASRLEQLEQSNVAMAAQISAGQTAALRTQAVAFAEDAIRVKKKAAPSERADLISTFELAAKADGANGRASFAADGALTEGANLAMVRKSIENRPVLSIFSSPTIRNGEPDAVTGTADMQAAATKILAGSIGAYNKGGGC